MVFCEQCAVLTQQLAFDPVATFNVELMSGALIYADERSMDWCSSCIHKMRKWFRFRYRLNVGDPVTAEELADWHRLKLEFSEWPLFRSDRCSSENAETVRRMVRHASRRFYNEIERLDLEFRKDQANSKDNA